MQIIFNDFMDIARSTMSVVNNFVISIIVTVLQATWQQFKGCPGSTVLVQDAAHTTFHRHLGHALDFDRYE